MTSKSDSPLVRYLRDPSLLLHDALELAREALSIAVDVAPIAGAIVLAIVVARAGAGRVRAHRLAKGARLVSIGVPSAAHSPYERMPKAMKRDWPGFAQASGKAICKQPQSDATLDWLGRMFGGRA